ncbi:MAG TPA: SDR family oxidoreductase [Bryobacteraceae bacterium]|nr:SDR family oxidoreductase [Bryobacteraceae bacterium]
MPVIDLKPGDLKGRTALVTGAGRGIGRAIALGLARAGASVMLNDLASDVDRDVVFETRTLIDQAGGAAKAMPGDLTKPDFPEKLVNATIAGWGSLDIIVNNAGYTWDNVIQKTTDEQFQAMLDIHVVAPFRVLRAASNWIRETAKKEQAEGRRVMRKVVNITSISGMDGIAGQAGYGSGKAGIIGLTKVMAKEWGRYNVNVNAVGFGFIETRLTQALGGEIDVQGRKIKVGVQDAVRETLRAQNPLGRFGTPEEAAGPVLFFCSALSDYVTGEVLLCSGGSHV